MLPGSRKILATPLESGLRDAWDLAYKREFPSDGVDHYLKTYEDKLSKYDEAVKAGHEKSKEKTKGDLVYSWYWHPFKEDAKPTFSKVVGWIFSGFGVAPFVLNCLRFVFVTGTDYGRMNCHLRSEKSSSSRWKTFYSGLSKALTGVHTFFRAVLSPLNSIKAALKRSDRGNQNRPEYNDSGWKKLWAESSWKGRVLAGFSGLFSLTSWTLIAAPVAAPAATGSLLAAGAQAVSHAVGLGTIGAHAAAAGVPAGVAEGLAVTGAAAVVGAAGIGINKVANSPNLWSRFKNWINSCFSSSDAHLEDDAEPEDVVYSTVEQQDADLDEHSVHAVDRLDKLDRRHEVDAPHLDHFLYRHSALASASPQEVDTNNFHDGFGGREIDSDQDDDDLTHGRPTPPQLKLESKSESVSDQEQLHNGSEAAHKPRSAFKFKSSSDNETVYLGSVSEAGSEDGSEDEDDLDELPDVIGRPINKPK